MSLKGASLSVACRLLALELPCRQNVCRLHQNISISGWLLTVNTSLPFCSDQRHETGS